MIGDLIASRLDGHSDLTVVLSSDSPQLGRVWGARCKLLSFGDDLTDFVEIWSANDPGIYGTAWQTLCIAGEVVVG